MEYRIGAALSRLLSRQMNVLIPCRKSFIVIIRPVVEPGDALVQPDSRLFMAEKLEVYTGPLPHIHPFFSIGMPCPA